MSALGAEPIQEGRPSSPLWLIGEAPGDDEVRTRRPFTGASGMELDRMLAEAGFARRDAFLTNVCHEQPPPYYRNGKLIKNDIGQWFLGKVAGRAAGAEVLFGRHVAPPIIRGVERLRGLLSLHRPRLIIALGNTPLWALTCGEWGILKWRASHLPTALASYSDPPIKLIPTVHPAAVLRGWDLRNLVVQDLRRAKREFNYPEIRIPPWQFLIRPSIDDALGHLHQIEHRLEQQHHTGAMLPLAADIETRGGQIACIGLAADKVSAACIPLMCVERREGYWNAQEEHLLVLALRRVLTHPAAHVIFQNGAYDLQYFARQYGFLPRMRDDTMLMQHVAFPGLRKGLDFLSSLYCEYHRYWKDDGKEWNVDGAGDEDRYWRYNCEDCVRTLECWHTLNRVLDSQGLRPQYSFQINEVFPIVLRMMLRGIRRDPERWTRIAAQLEEYIHDSEAWFTAVLGHPLNTASGPQMQRLFYEDLRIPPAFNRKTGARTLDDDALDRIERRNPLLAPLIKRVRSVRSARTIKANVLDSVLSPDGRSRSTINMAGTETFRFSSSADAFGCGGNMQNLTKGEEE